LAEAQSADILTLLDSCLEMREKYGYGCQPDLLRVWLGDAERFLTSLALYNERLLRKYNNGNHALLVSPPDDFYTPSVFDQYVRSLRASLLPGKIRFYFGGNDILRNRLREFRSDDPAVMAIGGLVHSLLNRCMWMKQSEKTMFTVNEDSRAA